MTKSIMNDIIQWDVKSWSTALKYWEEKVEWITVENALEIGGREGGLSLWLALKGKSVVCSDLHNVKETAEKLHTKHKVSALVVYQDIDATEIPYENHFDIVVFKSILGGIGSNNNIEIQKKVFKEIHKALKPGGKLLFAENLVASSFHQFFRKKFTKWGNTWRYVTVKEMHSFLSDFSRFDIKTTGVLGTFGRTERQRNILSSVDKAILNSISPTNWKYICYGVATK